MVSCARPGRCVQSHSVGAPLAVHWNQYWSSTGRVNAKAGRWRLGEVASRYVVLLLRAIDARQSLSTRVTRGKVYVRTCLCHTVENSARGAQVGCAWIQLLFIGCKKKKLLSTPCVASRSAAGLAQTHVLPILVCLAGLKPCVVSDRRDALLVVVAPACTEARSHLVLPRTD